MRIDETNFWNIVSVHIITHDELWKRFGIVPLRQGLLSSSSLKASLNNTCCCCAFDAPIHALEQSAACVDNGGWGLGRANSAWAGQLFWSYSARLKATNFVSSSEVANHNLFRGLPPKLELELGNQQGPGLLNTSSLSLFHPQRALLEQKQRRKRQEPLMVQPNTEARPRRSRTRRGEEQAPLVDSQLSIPSDVIMDGEEITTCLIDDGIVLHFV